MKPKEFFSRWKEGVQNLSPKRQLYSRMVGQIGSILGLTLALVVITIRGIWYFIPVLGCGVFLQLIAYIGTRQQYIATLKMEEILDDKKIPDGSKEIQEKINGEIEGDKNE